MRGMGYVMVCCVMVVMGLVPGISAGAKIQATIIDNDGTRHEVSDLKYYHHDTFFFSRGKERVKLKFKKIASIVFHGTGGTESRPLQITLRDGTTIDGTVFVGSAGSGQYVYGGGSQIVFTGTTDLGPFTIQLKDITQVIFRHTDAYQKSEETQGAAPADSLWATIVGRNGARFEVFDLSPPHRGAFEISRGEEMHRLTFGEIRRIEFMGDDSDQEEQVPVLVTLRDGTTLAGTTPVGSLRGTVNIYDRSDIMLSAKTTLGPLVMALRNVRDIAFHTPKSDAKTGEGKTDRTELEHAVNVDTSAVDVDVDTSATEIRPSGP